MPAGFRKMVLERPRKLIFCDLSSHPGLRKVAVAVPFPLVLAGTLGARKHLRLIHGCRSVAKWGASSPLGLVPHHVTKYSSAGFAGGPFLCSLDDWATKKQQGVCCQSMRDISWQDSPTPSPRVMYTLRTRLALSIAATRAQHSYPRPNPAVAPSLGAGHCADRG